MKKILFSFLIVLIASLQIMAQDAKTIVKGKVLDKSTNEPVIGANVIISGTTNGGITNLEGAFQFSTSKSGATKVIISFIGYETLENDITLSGGEVDLGEIQLGSDAIGLKEVEVIASVAIDRKTPVAVSTLKSGVIEEKIGNQEYPEVLKSTPGIYATKSGGGFGDSRINVRGFDQRNTAVLINGIPVNDMENGWVYWSNWAGLSDATRTMQVQRGLGASKLAISSVGGTINILTKTSDAKKGGVARLSVGNNGYLKYGLTLSTGLMSNGMAVTVAGSRTTGDGYVPGTFIDAWAYFGSISKNFGDKHQIVLTAVGAPQKHGQRTSNYDEETYGKKGNYWNSDYGTYEGSSRKDKIFSNRENFYHKPQIGLNHYFTISPKAMLSTSAYVSFGRGGGTGELINRFNGKRLSLLRTSEGLVDWQAMEDFNTGKSSLIVGSDTLKNTPDANGKYQSYFTRRASMNSHNWYGVLSSLNLDLNDNLSLIVGLDARYYVGQHYRRMDNLLGGDYFIDNADKNNPGRETVVGDKVAYNYDGVVAWYGAFSQLEYSKDKLSAFLSLSASNTGYKRIDYFSYLDSDPEQTSDMYNFLGYNVKGGLNYNLNDNHNVFVNGGTFKRAPIFGALFNTFTNANLLDNTLYSKSDIMENVVAVELGYGVRYSAFSANINLYNTVWANRSYRGSYTDVDGNIFTFVGLNDASHQGVEVDFLAKPIKGLEINGMVSIGNWVWKGDMNANLYDQDNNLVGDVQAKLDGLKVGDAAQTTAAFGIRYEFIQDLFLGIDVNHASNMYAKFDPVGGSLNLAPEQSWKVPGYTLMDLRAGYTFKVNNFGKIGISANVNNLLDNQTYITDAQDGRDHNLESARFYYGFGRTYTVGMKVEF